MNNSYGGYGYPTNNNNNNNVYPNSIYCQQTKIPVVNGREGANAFRMGIDSQVILLDISGKLIWIVNTDSAGYKTVQGYTITPYVEPEPPDYNVIMNKINQMEGMLSGLISAINNTGSAGANPTEPQPVANSASTNPTIDLSKQF